jgi:hypothetical protein
VDITKIAADETAQAELQRQIAQAGWHIIRDEQTADRFMVEFQRGDFSEFHAGAETRSVYGTSRTDAYRRFLDDLLVGSQA